MKCAVSNCKQNNSKKSTGRKSISYYSFPKDETQRELWVTFCNRKDTVNAQRERICSLHFKEEDFERNLKYEMGFTNQCSLKLKPAVVPTVETTATSNDVKVRNIETKMHEDENSSVTIDSIKDLERKIYELQQENHNLKKIQNQSAITIQNMNSQVQRLSFTNAYLEKALGRLFTEGQIKKIKNGDKCRDVNTLEMKEVKILGKAVYEWIRRMMYYKDILITDGLIQKMALQFKSAMGVQNFFPHQEWCDKFRSTYKISTCDSKMLNIGYTQGHSVQIKDVMKGVLSECSPDHDENNGHEVGCIEDGDDEDDNSKCENDCISIHSVEREMKVQTMLRKKTDKNVQRKPNNEANSKTVQITPHTQLQNLRQLVALPIQANGLPGMSQKVLIATPIVSQGQKDGSSPVSMTIIPLSSFAQPSNVVNPTTSVTTSLNKNNNDSNNYAKEQQVVVPPPILEIKKEIKVNPKYDNIEEMCQEEVIKIKKEYLTDDEDVADTPAKQPQTQIPSLQSNTPTHIVAIPLANKDMIEESTNDSLDDLTLSTLRKRIKTEQLSPGQNSPTERNSSPPPFTSITLRPLTKAPTEKNTTTSTISPKQTAAASLTPLPPSNHFSQKCLRADDNQPTIPPIQSYAEGRKYLKLLEDFALERENFRLIGLTTRADEVLKDFDRKENNEDEDVDID